MVQQHSVYKRVVCSVCLLLYVQIIKISLH
jgi:hypothetical protein